MPDSSRLLDLHHDIPATVSLMEERGEVASIGAVLEQLGVGLAPSLTAHKEDVPGRPARSDSSSGTLGRFELLQELGRGGMGRVVEARDPEIRRSVAIKTIIDPSNITADRLARFVAEAQITGQLQHPNIVPVYEVGLSPDGQLFFVMRKVDGLSMREVVEALREGDEAATTRWTRTKLLHGFIQLCNAVAYAHDRGVLHRDLKPANVMLGPFGEVVLMDWGVARILGEPAEAVAEEEIDRSTLEGTMDGAVIGTPGFMSPEQARGALADLSERSDVWSLGAILYELLTLQRAYVGPNMYALMLRTVSGPPIHPRERSPERDIPEEVAGICLRAMSPDPADRFATATELASAVEAFLDGVRRREEAGRHVDAAREAWQRYGELGLELERWHRTVREQEATVPRWASLDQKRALHGARRRIRDLGPQRARAFAELVAACERALSHDPGHDPARELMAEAWFGRLREGEARRDVEAVDYAEERVRAYDDHRFAALLQGTGALTLETTPDGAEVFAQRFDTRPLIWTLDPPRPLGRTPLSEAPLEMGSYLLTIRAPGRRDTRYPVRIDRGAHWQGGAPLPLLSEADIGHGFLYVPGGPFLCGGDEQAGDCTARDERPVPGFLLARYPVTVRDYCRFLDALHGDDPDAAWARVPRTEVGATGDSGRAWSRPDAGGRYDDEHLRGQLEQDEWSWPVAGISWEDARACAGWLHPGGRLPTEHEWEKAARGVDGRAFPWGDHFDSSLCKMRDSRQGRPRPEPVGVFEPDRSVFGVRDLAGGIREWCGDTSYGPDATRRPIRGGSWFAYARFCRSAHRNGHEPWFVHSNHGFRVALPLAGEVSEP